MAEIWIRFLTPADRDRQSHDPSQVVKDSFGPITDCGRQSLKPSEIMMDTFYGSSQRLIAAFKRLLDILHN